jgi:acylphosphatase
MDLHINIGAKLINQFTGKGVLGFVQFNEDGTVNYLQSGYKKKAKEGIKKQITTALTRCLQDTDFNWFAKGVMLGSTSADWIVQLNSPLTIQYLTQITGLNFADPDVRGKFQGSPLIVTEFVRTFRHIV